MELQKTKHLFVPGTQPASRMRIGAINQRPSLVPGFYIESHSLQLQVERVLSICRRLDPGSLFLRNKLY